METIETKITKMLVDHGLFEDQAKVVLDCYKADAVSAPLNRRWNDPVADYPPAIVIATWIGVRMVAARWIKENCPKHWALLILDGGTR